MSTQETVPFVTKQPAPKILSIEDYVQLPPIAANHRFFYGSDPSQFADLYLPTQSGDYPGDYPVVILLHGGCWLAEYGLSPLGQLCKAFTQEGLAVWSLEYRRLGNGGGWMTTFEDVANGVEFLRSIKEQYALDLSRLIAVGHSAGGHLALWLAGRHHLPPDSPLFSTTSLPLQGVVSLAGIPDLAGAGKRNICGSACYDLVGGLPEERPHLYQQASPIALLPLGIPQWHIFGQEDELVPADSIESYLAIARQHDEVHYDLLPNTGHFEVVVPGTLAWQTVRHAVLTLIR